eukprot:TRINITY_DN27362_c0_g1_i1.p1 TRINITY_DN27362_c0_g1~~TRINITY_DN27362_c0_g1_i1.p1  ORF type:complete len:700 (+),score=87.26 TRINITY_DN27362_c0_g1_i1:98-2197(+)
MIRSSNSRRSPLRPRCSLQRSSLRSRVPLRPPTVFGKRNGASYSEPTRSFHSVRSTNLPSRNVLSTRSRVPVSRPLGAGHGYRADRAGQSHLPGSKQRSSVSSRIGSTAGSRPGLGSSRLRLVAERVRARQRLLTPEASLEEKQLHCGGIPGPLAWPSDRSGDWRSVLFDEKRRSFVSYRRDAFKSRELDTWWDDLTTKVKWTQPKVGERRLPRKAAWLTEGKCKCVYRYGGTSWPAITWEPWFVQLTKRVCKACGVVDLPNSCNANLYVDGKQSVGWHADDEPLFAATRRDALIISLSLGASRRFEVHPIGSPAEITKVVLADGDLCTMEGLMQRHYKHRVPIEKDIDGPRVNLTWRWIVKHDSDCPCFQIQEPDDSLPSSQSLRSATLQTKRPLKRSVSRDPMEEAKRHRRADRFGQEAPSVSSEAVGTELQASTTTPDNLGREIIYLRELCERVKSQFGGESAEVLAQVSIIVEATKKLRQGTLLPREIRSLDEIVATASAMKAEAESAQTSEGSEKKSSSRSSRLMEPPPQRPVRVAKVTADMDSASASKSSSPCSEPAAGESAKSDRASMEEKKRQQRLLRFDKAAKDRDRSRVDTSRPVEASQNKAPSKTFEPAEAKHDKSPAKQPAISSSSSTTSASSKAERLVTKTRSSSEAKDTTAKPAVVSVSKDAEPTQQLSEAEKRRRRAERFGTAR